jgi:hypothetical protein
MSFLAQFDSSQGDLIEIPSSQRQIQLELNTEESVLPPHKRPRRELPAKGIQSPPSSRRSPWRQGEGQGQSLSSRPILKCRTY